MEQKLRLKPSNENYELRSFKSPKTDIYDERLAKKQLEDFEKEGKELPKEVHDV